MTFQDYIKDLPVEEQQVIVAEIMGLSDLFATRMEKIGASIATSHLISLGFYEGVTGKLEQIANEEIKQNASRFSRGLINGSD